MLLCRIQQMRTLGAFDKLCAALGKATEVDKKELGRSRSQQQSRHVQAITLTVLSGIVLTLQASHDVCLFDLPTLPAFIFA